MAHERDRPAFRQPGIHHHVVALIDAGENVADVALDGLRRDAVRGVVSGLLLPAAIRLSDSALHAACDLVGIKNNTAIHVPRGPADRLDQRRFRAQKAFLVRIEDGDECAFRDVQPFTQQVDADENVECAEPKIADDLDALQCIHVGVHIPNFQALFRGHTP